MCTTKPGGLAIPRKPRPDPRLLLDDAKRSRILALLANGSSRRVAASMVGCAPSTITRTAARDPEFAAQLARAQFNLEVDALRALRNAAQEMRYWRAAAWILERRNPDDFGPRPPKLFSQAEVAQFLADLVGLLQGDEPQANCERAIRWLDTFVLSLEQEPAPADAPQVLQPPPIAPLNTPSTIDCADFNI